MFFLVVLPLLLIPYSYGYNPQLETLVYVGFLLWLSNYSWLVV